jgi:hypothetical protein
MGKLTFAIIVIAVILRDNAVFADLQTSDWILLLGLGFIIMCIGNILNEHDKRKKWREEQERREKWIKSLHGKQ